MVGNSLGGLQEHLKLAREYALEGLYDTSIIFFDGAIAQINKYSSLSLSLYMYISMYLCPAFFFYTLFIFIVKFILLLHNLSWVSVVFVFCHNPLL